LGGQVINLPLQIPDRFFDNTDFIAGGNGAALMTLPKNTSLGMTHLPTFWENGAADMAFLADLGDFQDHFFPDFDVCADRDGDQVNAFGGQILGKSTGPSSNPSLRIFINAFIGQETDLTMGSGIGMGITNHPVAYLKLSGRDNIFAGAFLIRCGKTAITLPVFFISCSSCLSV